jgi:hypothetical protein
MARKDNETKKGRRKGNFGSRTEPIRVLEEKQVGGHAYS